MSFDYTEELKAMNAAITEQFNTKRKLLRDLDLFVLDNSIRETTAGQIRGHTLENKIKIYAVTKKCGFEHVIVASFDHMDRVDETFCQWLIDSNESRSNMFALSKIADDAKDGKLDLDSVPVSMKKCKKYEIANVILEMSLTDPNIDWDEKFPICKFCKLLKTRLNWCYENLSPHSKVLFNIQDFSAAMKTSKGAARVLHVVGYLGSLPNRGFGICIEETAGESFPEEVGAWCAAVRKVMNQNNWYNGKLLVHIHKRWGMATVTQLESLANGANGIWAGVCEEGASVGHASSIVTIMNLVRMGNEKVLTKYSCQYLRKAAIKVTELTTGRPPHFRELIYGERALDLWIPEDSASAQKFDLAGFFHEKPLNRISDLASTDMIEKHLVHLFGSDVQCKDDVITRMKKLLLEDMSFNRKEEYMSDQGAALLFMRAGGKITSKMKAVIDIALT